MLRTAPWVLALVLAAGIASAEPAISHPTEERRIRAEPSIARTVLAAPYALVSVVAWPVKQLVVWMESVNLPARVGDAVTFPVRVIRGEEDE